MSRRSVRPLLAVAVLWSGAWIGVQPAQASTSPEVGVWWQLQSSDGALPAPRLIPAGGLWYQSGLTGDSAVSAFRFTVPEGEVPSSVVLPRAEDRSVPALAALDACTPTTWAPPAASPGAWANRPTADCKKLRLKGTAGPDGGIKFDLAPLGAVSVVNLVLVREEADTTTAIDATFEAPIFTTTPAPQAAIAPTSMTAEPPPEVTGAPLVEAPPSASLTTPSIGQEPMAIQSGAAPESATAEVGTPAPSSATGAAPTPRATPAAVVIDRRDRATWLGAIAALLFGAWMAAIAVQSLRSGQSPFAGRYTIYRGAPPQ